MENNGVNNINELLQDATLKGDVVILRDLLGQNPFLLHKSSNIYPLHIASKLGHLQFTQELLRINPSLAEELDPTDRSSPLHLASGNGHVELVKTLVSTNACMCLARDVHGRNPAHVAAMKGHVRVLEELLTAVPAAARERVGLGGDSTIMHLCVKCNQLEALWMVANAVGDAGMLLNATDGDGNTILHIGVADKRLEEIWNSPYSNDSFPVYAEDIDAGGSSSPSTAMLSEVSQALKITIVGGSIPERCGDRLYNTCCIFDTDGKLKAKHRKIHLFDIDIPGKITFMESKTLTAGETPTVVDTEVGRIGVGICYDMRFQELAMLYAARGCHLICYPGAFNMTTGPLHWELLQRARAVDNQLYVATCAPARDLSAGYTAWGHSTLVGPFGEVLATTEHEEATIISEVDYSVIELRRTNLPLEKQRRGDIYQLVDIQRSQLGSWLMC